MTIFGKGELDVVRLGYDADTVGSVYGGLAGAFYCAGAIPTNWVEGTGWRALGGGHWVEGLQQGDC
ncbi:hypothetical protein AJ78_08902 [Emergomyces pasteurianus Ep9510]|uniref:ADP-ribosylglycohydrolase n=1 Tax=Emergomyces pasteurianus Ep9510 TaxID=1447872 RepID=A0A1J9Q3U1_9EURO|nr:hypothetical protein AJ78_08902 [Emergomyces pasteurianus Ep9510]